MRYSYVKYLDILTDWATKQGFKSISFDHTDISYVDWTRDSLNEPKVIKIQGKYNNEEKTYLMLHECGHHILRKDWEKFHKMFPTAAHAEEKQQIKKQYKFKRRTTYIVATIEEECLAWSRGYELATKLGIHINIEKWSKFKTKMLMSYIRFYGSK